MRSPGPAILPTFLASEALVSGGFVSVLPEYAPSGGQVNVVYRKTVRTSPKIQALVRFLEDEIGHPARWDVPLIERGLLPHPSPT